MPNETKKQIETERPVSPAYLARRYRSGMRTAALIWRDTGEPAMVTTACVLRELAKHHGSVAQATEVVKRTYTVA